MVSSGSSGRLEWWCRGVFNKKIKKEAEFNKKIKKEAELCLCLGPPPRRKKGYI